LDFPGHPPGILQEMIRPEAANHLVDFQGRGAAGGQKWHAIEAPESGKDERGRERIGQNGEDAAAGQPGPGKGTAQPLDAPEKLRPGEAASGGQRDE
jgi:hypothetical protein